MKSSIFVLSLILGLSIGCADQSVEKFRERAEAEQQGANKVENENLASKASSMERDLTARHRFYSAIEGVYEGELIAEGEVFRMKMTFVRSLPPYTELRVRQLSEIENDLSNLFFHIQVLQWFPEDPTSVVSCRVSGIKPNMDDGALKIASPDCPNLYVVYLAEETAAKSSKEKIIQAKSAAEKVKNSTLNEVPVLTGEILPSSNIVNYTYTLQKMK
jgi:hypothetical protein